MDSYRAGIEEKFFCACFVGHREEFVGDAQEKKGFLMSSWLHVLEIEV